MSFLEISNDITDLSEIKSFTSCCELGQFLVTHVYPALQIIGCLFFVHRVGYYSPGTFWEPNSVAAWPEFVQRSETPIFG